MRIALPLRGIAFLFGVLNKSKATLPQGGSYGSFYFQLSLVQAQLDLKIKIPGAFAPRLLTCSGGRT
jgi:hypothetical protein